MTQVFQQPLSEVPNWAKLPLETVVKLAQIKQEANQPAKKHNTDEFEEDLYSREAFCKQYGVEP